MPKDYKIRTAGSEDLEKIARVHVDCWKTTYSGIVPERKLERLNYEKSAEKWKCSFSHESDSVSKILLLDHNGQTVGFCSGGRIRRASKRTGGYEGEIKAFYILPDHQRKGMGTELLKEFERLFIKNRIFSYMVWVLKDNSSKNFYKKLGGKLLTTKTYEIGGKKLKGLCYGYKIPKQDEE